jgi:hypothetical protein
MNKLKNIALIAAAVFLLSLAAAYRLQSNKIDRLNKEINRISANNAQLVQDTTQKRTLILSERKDKEHYKKLYHEKDSLAKVYGTRPKYVDKIVYRTINEKITTVKPVPVSLISKNTWKIKDVGPCFVWEGIAYLSNDSLSVKRTLFDYQNNLTGLHFRTAKHFLFIRVSKFRYFERDTSQCGDMKVREYQFVK